mmetsp:Transcript_16888/g.36563  ORF Transcript_16888/g.36563 Transcript_16888/m.36563 type:complete len:309 (-) Transcript_16888:900-1826(-)|eukprot:CAMPEP_0202909390 /NCGR_PEP_ID=MMETSP1392-20130828/49171_1 /ASSEMBLY_ACC=CAM_ASM_000868 /TAXON_ID=225041 /ORGANISM="Chlamydomonas chlamydogama, Strain SAG 11-48b" /LENGTH=308 /DNA_ID=CAMNT_0049599125 /DNA_START=139 /DNA_END=1065 /DNA_ORIENTATION=+
MWHTTKVFVLVQFALSAALTIASADGNIDESGHAGCRRLVHQLTYLTQEVKAFRNEQAIRSGPASNSAEDDLFLAIDSKFDMINEYTRIKHPDYPPGHWGIANKNLDDKLYYYGTTKTRYVFNELRQRILSPKIRTVCEIGFNAGHSATLFLDSIPHATFYEFDLGDFPWALSNSKLIKGTYGARFNYIKGDSHVTIPEFAKNGTKCDVIFVDGAKGEGARRNDVLNVAKHLAHQDTFVFGDEANTFECMSGFVNRTHAKCLEGPYGDTPFAWNSLVREGYLDLLSCSSPSRTADLVCLWKLTAKAFA